MGKQIAPPGAEEQEGEHGQAVPFHHDQAETDEPNAAQLPEQVQEPTGIVENDDSQHQQNKKNSTRSPRLSEDPASHKAKSASLDRDGLLAQDGHHLVDHNNRDDEQMHLQVKRSSATAAQNVKVGEGENLALFAGNGEIAAMNDENNGSSTKNSAPAAARASSPAPSSGAHDQLHMSFTTKESDSGQENEKVAEEVEEVESPEGERIIPSMNQVDEEAIQDSDNAAGVTPVSLSSGELDDIDRLTKKASSPYPVPPLKFEIISHAKRDIEEEIQMEKQMGMMHNSQNKTKTNNLQQLEKGLDFVKKEISPSNSPRSENSASSKATSSNRSAGRQGWSNALSLLKEKKAIARGEKPNFISVVKAAIRNKKSIQIDNEQAKKMAELKRKTAEIAVEAEQSANKSAGAAAGEVLREQYVVDPRSTAMSRGSMLPDPRETAQQVRSKSGNPNPGAGYDPRMSTLSRGTVLLGKSPRSTAMSPLVRGEASASQRVSDGSRGTAGSEADRSIPMPEFTLGAETKSPGAPRQSAATSTEINANNNPLPAVPAGSKKKLSVASSSAAIRGSSAPGTTAAGNKASTNKQNKAATKGSSSEQRAASTSSTTKGKGSVNKKSTASNASLVEESSEKRSSSFPKAKVRLYRSKKEQSSAELGEGAGEQQSKEQRKADIVAAAAAGAAASSSGNNLTSQEQTNAAGTSGAASSSLSPRINKKQTDQNCASGVLTNCWAGINLAFATIGCGFSKTEEKKDFKPKQRKLKNSREASPRTQSTSPRGGNLNLRNDGTNMQSVQKESRSTGGTSNAGSSTGRPSNVFESLLASDEFQDRISNFRAALQELDNDFRGSIKRDMNDLVTNRLISSAHMFGSGEMQLVMLYLDFKKKCIA